MAEEIAFDLGKWGIADMRKLTIGSVSQLNAITYTKDKLAILRTDGSHRTTASKHTCRL